MIEGSRAGVCRSPGDATKQSNEKKYNNMNNRSNELT